MGTCNASSLVGVIISARREPPLKTFSSEFLFSWINLPSFSLSSRRRCKIGSAKASVFPEPVSAAPMTSYFTIKVEEIDRLGLIKHYNS